MEDRVFNMIAQGKICASSVIVTDKKRVEQGNFRKNKKDSGRNSRPDTLRH